jgi:pimeloyl-ACP methyl ester carboxylesterase
MPENDDPRRLDWTAIYYHKADAQGIGFDRTRTGSGAVDQYAKVLADRLNDPKTTPEKWLLFFHHLPWDYKLASGQTLWQGLVAHYHQGAAQAAQMEKDWAALKGSVDDERHAAVAAKLTIQARDAAAWRDKCLAYFAQFSKQPTTLSAPAASGAQDGPQSVAIPAPDGPAIQADVYGTGPRAVVLLHGGRFDKRSWRPQAEQLVQRGFRVVAIDFRASVESRAGRETSCGYDAACLAKDVTATIAYLRRSGATSVALVGASLGGGAAAQAATEVAPGEIDRVVLLAHMTIDHPERLKTPALFIVARDDANAGGPRLPGIREQYEKAQGPKELVVLDGAAHAQFLFASPQGDAAMRAVLRFLDSPTAAVPR